MTTAPRNSHAITLLSLFGVLLLVSLACNLPTEAGTSQPAEITIGQSPDPALTSVPATVPGSDCMKGIRPGATTRAEALAILGEPQETDAESGLEILTYPTANHFQDNTVAIKNGVVDQVNEFFDENSQPAWSEIARQLGGPEKTTYSNYLPSSMTYIYAVKGTSFIADKSMDVVFERSCFVPMSIDMYMTSLGANLPLENPFVK